MPKAKEAQIPRANFQEELDGLKKHMGENISKAQPPSEWTTDIETLPDLPKSDYWAEATSKALGEKMAKGEPLTKAEAIMLQALMKGKIVEDEYFASGRGNVEKADDLESEEDVAMMKGDDEDDDMEKSLNEVVKENPEMAKALDVSEFLVEFIGTIDKALVNMESRLEKKNESAVMKAIRQFAGEQQEFQKSLATAVYGIGQAVKTNADQVSDLAATPSAPPKSQMNAQSMTVEKSFAGGGGNDVFGGFGPDQVLGAMEELAKSNLGVSDQDIICFQQGVTNHTLPGAISKAVSHLRNPKNLG
jgi:hypothetical protein